MTDDLSVLRVEPLATALNDMEELLTQSGRAFLLGAGCSKCANLPLTAELTEKTLESDKIGADTKNILNAIKQLFDGSNDSNIEDYLSELVDLNAIAQRRQERGADSATVELGGASFTTDQLQSAVEEIKRAIAAIIDTEIIIDTHQKFVRAVHLPLRPGKSGTNPPVDYLILNYDTLIEDALAIEKLHYSDGLGGGTTAWWDMSQFEMAGLAARVLKLHGSIDWCELPDDPLPRRISKKLTGHEIENRRVIIWPASTKYRETQRDPYAQLASLARRIMRPSKSTQTVLTVCGYRFQDSHINLEIDRALRESDGRLTIVAFTSDEVPIGQLKIWHEDPVVSDQVRIYAKKGFYHGATNYEHEAELPWWKFENVTRLLEGER
ncbi:MAG: SIR2 family protein [Gammaproteobacteria bacterium]|nr:SIR2 family protein [Gammaproteobacteria bacterium]